MSNLCIGVTYFRKYHADFDQVDTELHTIASTFGVQRSFHGNEDQRSVMWWNDVAADDLTQSEIALKLMTELDIAALAFDRRSPDLITVSLSCGPHYFSMHRTFTNQAEREAAADVERAALGLVEV